MKVEEIRKINEILSDIEGNGLDYDLRKSIKTSEYSNNMWRYAHKITEDIYVVIESEEDSYGENEKVVSVQIMKPVVVEVTEFKKY